MLYIFIVDLFINLVQLWVYNAILNSISIDMRMGYIYIYFALEIKEFRKTHRPVPTLRHFQTL